jgi:conjugative relaxase-like TrwC/TraI family protein
MMSLTPMAPSAWRYYVEEVARGREDYYAHSAEHAGRFTGRGAEALGVSGMEAEAVSLERLFGHGADPRDGSPLGRGFSPEDSRAVAGFALTFSPPKTVSVLWALADVEISNEVGAAHDAAVSSALSFVDEHASFTRRGHNGVLQVDTDGLIAAGFVHRTSRTADPQLHTHLLVANKVRAEDGKWLSLDARELFETQKAAGMLYKAALRAELTSRLGVAFTPVDENGVAEIAGVPHLLVEQWSARRHELKVVRRPDSNPRGGARAEPVGERAGGVLPDRRLPDTNAEDRRRHPYRRAADPVGIGGRSLRTRGRALDRRSDRAQKTASDASSGEGRRRGDPPPRGPQRHLGPGRRRRGGDASSHGSRRRGNPGAGGIPH